MGNPCECDGCNVSYISSTCFASHIEGCPCKNCLIKIMCTNPCKELGSHLGKTKLIQKERCEKENRYGKGNTTRD